MLDSPTETSSLLQQNHPNSGAMSSTETSSRSSRENKSDSQLLSTSSDHCNVLYFYFYFLGLATLLPWNFFITANDYWMYKLRNVTEDTIVNSTTDPTPVIVDNITKAYEEMEVVADSNQFTPLQVSFQSCLAIFSMWTCALFQFLNTALHRLINQHVRMAGSLIIMSIMFIFTLLLVKVNTDQWQVAFFFITMGSAVIVNMVSGIFQSGLFGIVAKLPLKYIGAVMGGQGMGGVFAASCSILTLAVAPEDGTNDPTLSALMFFLIAAVVLLMAVFVYGRVFKNDYYKFCVSEVDNRAGRSSSSSDDDSEKALLNGNGKSKHDANSNEKEDVAFINKKDDGVLPLLVVFKKVGLHFFCCSFTFFITLACFPAITASVQTSNADNKSWSKFFIPVCCFLLFNLSDWIGRTAASSFRIFSVDNRIGLLIACLLRLAFPFLFMCCNVQPRTLPVFFNNDIFFVTFMIMFGCSNGYLSTLCMQYGPKQVNSANATTAGSMLSTGIAVGLAVGAAMSFPLKLLV